MAGTISGAREAVRQLGTLPADTGYLQTDPSQETGRVTVSFANGQPEYTVNLRDPFYSAEVIQESLALATVVKMNDAEVPIALSLLGLSLEGDSPAGVLRLGASRLLSEFPALQMVAITRGGHGTLLVGRDGWHEHSGYPIKVADTIGAGDAFTAAMTHYLLRGAGLATLNEAGNRWGGWVASQSGAMPTPSRDRAHRGQHGDRTIQVADFTEINRAETLLLLLVDLPSSAF